VKPCVVPVSTDDAIEWAAGRLKDVDLLLRTPMVPEGIFLVNLDDRAGYRDLLKKCLYWYMRGAIFLVARTGTPIVELHLEKKNGCIRLHREDTHPVKYRFICPPDAFKRWVSKWGRSLAKDAPQGKADAGNAVIL